ncbi:MAG: YfiR family protein [Burkholderiales bacterium]
MGVLSTPSATLRSRRRLLAQAFGIGLALTGLGRPGAVRAGTADAEVQIKSAFLYKFLTFIEWPSQVFDQPTAALTIGVLGADRLGDELSQLAAGRQAGGRPITVRRLRAGEALTGLHVLFIGRPESNRTAAAVAAAKGQPMLVVTESDQAFAMGSAINFVVVDDKVRFDVALQPAEQVGLKISARLLSVARKVVTNAS